MSWTGRRVGTSRVIWPELAKFKLRCGALELHDALELVQKANEAFTRSLNLGAFAIDFELNGKEYWAGFQFAFEGSDMPLRMVVLERPSFRLVSRSSPLAWNSWQTVDEEDDVLAGVVPMAGGAVPLSPASLSGVQAIHDAAAEAMASLRNPLPRFCCGTVEHGELEDFAPYCLELVSNGRDAVRLCLARRGRSDGHFGTVVLMAPWLHLRNIEADFTA